MEIYNKDQTIKLRIEPVMEVNKVVNHLKQLHNLDLKRFIHLSKKDTASNSYHILVYEDSKGIIHRQEFYA